MLLRKSAISLLLLLSAVSAVQARGGRGNGQTGQQETPQPSSTSKPPAAIPEPWPRLDAGAVLCNSRDELVKYQTQLADGVNVLAAAQGSSCQIIRKQTGVQILDHDGQSRTQIVTTDDAKQTGWTNTFFPDTPPSTAAKGK